MADYWLKQVPGQALFPATVWARPETKGSAGKLLVIGGHAQSFAAPAEAYAAAEKAGIGVVRVLLPDSLEKTVRALFPAAEFAPSNPSGGFARNTLAEALAAAQWADGVLLAGDLGRNSETAAMLENFSIKCMAPLTIAQDAADFFCAHPTSLLARHGSLLVLTTTQLQRLGVALQSAKAFTSDMGVVQAVEWLHAHTLDYPGLYLVVRHLNHYIVAVEGQVSTTTDTTEIPNQEIQRAASAATWWLQTPAKPFEAITSAML